MSSTNPTTSHAAGARPGAPGGARVVRAVIWLPGLAVALGAAVATAHGLYEVAHAARVPPVIAWLYPLITDGLALVAYAATARLTGSAARYAWSVVVLAAGLSGLAQAAFLASGSTVDASPALRFGVGAWPAIAAAIVAHLLYLLATDSESETAERHQTQPTQPPRARSTDTVQSVPFSPDAAPPAQRLNGTPAIAATVQRSATGAPTVPSSSLPAGPVEQAQARPVESPARDRARAAAQRHAHRHGALPTVTELEAAAEVSRGTASNVLKALRAQPAPLHLITRSEPDDDPTIEEQAQP